MTKKRRWVRMILIAVSALFLVVSVGALVSERAAPDTAPGRMARAALDVSLSPWVSGRSGAWLSIGWKVGIAALAGGALLLRRYRRLYGKRS